MTAPKPLRPAFLALAASACLLMACACSPQEPEAPKLDPNSVWIMDFYKHPEPQRLAEVFRALLPISEKNGPNMVVFFAYALRAHPEAVGRFFDMVLSLKDDVGIHYGLRALWLSDTDAARTRLADGAFNASSPALQTYLEGMLAHPVPDLCAEPVQSPARLDMLWAAFFATGDPTPVRRVMAVAALDPQGDAKRKVVVEAAKWSLAAVQKDHAAVRGIVARYDPIPVHQDLDFSYLGQ